MEDGNVQAGCHGNGRHFSVRRRFQTIGLAIDIAPGEQEQIGSLECRIGHVYLIGHRVVRVDISGSDAGDGRCHEQVGTGTDFGIGLGGQVDIPRLVFQSRT